MKIQPVKIYTPYFKHNAPHSAKADTPFCSREDNLKDPIQGFLNYLGVINREIIIPDDKFDAPEDEIFKGEDFLNKPNIDEYDLKIRKLEYLEKNGLKDIDSNLKQSPENFFIRIPGYGKNQKWARFMVQSANYASVMIKNSESFDKVMEAIAKDCSEWEFSNIKYACEFEKAERTGVSRLDAPQTLATRYDMSGIKYGAYGDRFSDLALNASKQYLAKEYRVKTPKQFPDFSPTRIYFNCSAKSGNLAHPASSVEPALRYSREIYEDLTQNYMNKKLTKADIKEVNKKIASIHWLLAHGTPYLRGSDAIVNTFVKSLYSALGFKLSPPREGISFDLEAFSTEYRDFVKNYPSLYENEPEYLC